MGEEKKAGVNRRRFVQGCLSVPALASLPALPNLTAADATDDRATWLRIVTKISTPVLEALSQRKLKEKMPVEAPHGNVADRKQFTYLEAMGRLLCGLAPWIESGATSGEEGTTRARFAEWTRAGLQSATDPASPVSAPRISPGRILSLRPASMRSVVIGASRAFFALPSTGEIFSHVNGAPCCSSIRCAR